MRLPLTHFFRLDRQRGPAPLHLLNDTGVGHCLGEPGPDGNGPAVGFPNHALSSWPTSSVTGFPTDWTKLRSPGESQAPHDHPAGVELPPWILLRVGGKSARRRCCTSTGRPGRWPACPHGRVRSDRRGAVCGPDTPPPRSHPPGAMPAVRLVHPGGLVDRPDRPAADSSPAEWQL